MKLGYRLTVTYYMPLSYRLTLSYSLILTYCLTGLPRATDSELTNGEIPSDISSYRVTRRATF